MTLNSTPADRYPSRIVAVSLSRTKGVKKDNVAEAKALVGFGLEGDAHGGAWHRQVSLLALESIEKMRGKGMELQPGDFAENLTTEGIDLPNLPVGTRLKIGPEVEMEVTQIGKTCHDGCAIKKRLGECVMPTEGIFAKVLHGGVVRPGDAIELVHG
ncbi:MOSC domain-containing protein [Desulfobacca acetoxidans]